MKKHIMTISTSVIAAITGSLATTWFSRTEPHIAVNYSLPLRLTDRTLAQVSVTNYGNSNGTHTELRLNKDVLPTMVMLPDSRAEWSNDGGIEIAKIRPAETVTFTLEVPNALNLYPDNLVVSATTDNSTVAIRTFDERIRGAMSKRVYDAYVLAIPIGVLIGVGSMVATVAVEVKRRKKSPTSAVAEGSQPL